MSVKRHIHDLLHRCSGLAWRFALAPQRAKSESEPSESGRPHSLGPLAKKSLWLGTTAAAVLVLSYGTYLGWRELSKQQLHIDYRYLVPSFVAYSVVLAIVLVNWNSIMKSLGTTVGFRRNMKLYCFTNLTKHLPSALWLIGSRLYLYEREGVSKGLTSTGISLELTLLTSSNIIVCLVMLPLYPVLQTHQAILGLLVLVPLLAVMLHPALLPRLVNYVRGRLKQAPLTIVLERRSTLLWCASYSLGWLIGGVFLYLLLLAIYPEARPYLTNAIGAWALSALVSRLRFILPIGVGWREITLAALLSSIMPLPTAVLASVVSKFWLAISEGIWLLISLAL